MLRFVACVLFVILLTATGLKAQEPADISDRAAVPNRDETSRQVQQSVCLLLESAANANGLPVEFFVRLIWRESRFRPIPPSAHQPGAASMLWVLRNSCRRRQPNVTYLTPSIP